MLRRARRHEPEGRMTAVHSGAMARRRNGAERDAAALICQRIFEVDVRTQEDRPTHALRASRPEVPAHALEYSGFDYVDGKIRNRKRQLNVGRRQDIGHGDRDRYSLPAAFGAMRCMNSAKLFPVTDRHDQSRKIGIAVGAGHLGRPSPQTIRRWPLPRSIPKTDLLPARLEGRPPATGPADRLAGPTAPQFLRCPGPIDACSFRGMFGQIPVGASSLRPGACFVVDSWAFCPVEQAASKYANVSGDFIHTFGIVSLPPLDELSLALDASVLARALSPCTAGVKCRAQSDGTVKMVER